MINYSISFKFLQLEDWIALCQSFLNEVTLISDIFLKLLGENIADTDGT